MRKGAGIVCAELADESPVGRARGWASIELARTNEPGLGVGDHLVPMGDPADRAGHGEDRREHRERSSVCFEAPNGLAEEFGEGFSILR